MLKADAHFSSEELTRVLSHYDIGAITRVKPLSAGDRSAPKMVILSEQGKFLLKRRLKGKDNLYRVAFAHAVQIHLQDNAFPVSPLVRTHDKNNTILHLKNHIYECFKFAPGSRYDGTAQATIDAGRQLAKFHRHLSDFASHWNPLRGSFHNSAIVRSQLKTIGAQKTAGAGGESGHNSPAANDQRKTAEALTALYNNSAVRVNQLGFDSWRQQVVHGDWHPGNMLFQNRRLTAVLDFDAIKIAPPATDLANGMLQFSIVGIRPNPADWPDYLDQAKLVQFLKGYREVKELRENELNSLLDLMIETIIAEAILPVAATGFFGYISGTDFLNMIRRKAEWMDKNRDKLTEAIND
jgi:homoserine kinase type II